MTASTPALVHARALAAERSTLWMGVALIVALALLVVAWILPIMSVEKFPFWRNQVSLWGTLKNLLREREYFLLVVLVLFSMVFPLVKNLAGLWVWARLDPASPEARRRVRWIEALGKWSMLDVFLVAIAVAAVKITIISDVTVHAGIYVFCASVLLSMVLMHLIGRAIDKRAGPARA